ncbi:E3 ubiquitin-protein ligase rnf123, partial [Plakobranchus ocellatus]
MHIKAPDDPNLAKLIPNVWWDKNLKKDEDDSDDGEDVAHQEETHAEGLNKKKFDLCCQRLGERIQELEAMQVELLKCLLKDNDCFEGKTSRDLFLLKLKTFLRDHSTFNRPQVAQCSLPVILCFFHRLIQALRFFWDQTSLPSSEAFMPIQCFWSETRDYFELLRCGGLMSHLNRRLGAELNKVQGIEVQEDGKMVKKPVKDGGAAELNKVQGIEVQEDGKMVKKPVKDASAVISKSDEEYPKLDPLLGNSLEEILDCIVLLYHIAAHRQLGKMCALRESMLDFVVNLRDTERKMRKCPEELGEVRDYLDGAKQVFTEKIVEQARQMVWVEKVIYSPSKQRDLAWLLNVVLKTVERASQFNRLFQYVPEFYIETAVNAFNALRNYLHPTTSFHAIQGLPSLLSQYARFLVTHFFDSRLISNDLKDTLVQALACFTCYPDTLKVLEEMPMENRILMIQSLISPYENRSWAHTNWILVRIWKGCGFGYRYRYLPNLIPHKAQPTEFSYVSLQKPCPSQEFQSLLAKILLDDESRSTKFLDSLMNQLNWSFSEFVGIIQEIQSQGSRAEPLMQVKICAACFEISVCLLRVLEMVATVAPQVFTDWSRPSAELFLKRLMQLLSQIMSRVTMKEGPFENTVALPIHGLDTVTFYPILTVTVGIMAQLIVRCGGSSQEKATRSLLLDSGFSLDSLKFVLGDNTAIRGKPDKVFSFRKFDEISAEEMEDVEKLLSYLSQQQISLSASEEVVKEEELCTICYANRQQAVFVPCGHKSC